MRASRVIHAVDAHAAGRVFVTNGMDNSVSMVDARSAAVLRTVPVGPNPLAITVDEHVSRAFVLGGGLWHNGHPFSWSTVDLLDTRSGAVLHTASVGIGAKAIAVDERSGYVVVANSGDADRDQDPGAINEYTPHRPIKHARAAYPEPFAQPTGHRVRSVCRGPRHEKQRCPPR
jgi:YVTN family beta-propeller protein